MRLQLRLLPMAVVCIAALIASGCTLSLANLPGLPPSGTPLPASLAATATSLPRAQSVFIAQLPEPLANGESLALALLDEVTGLSLNAQMYPMQQINPLTYSATLALPNRAVIKYRYVRLGASQSTEDDASDRSIRYRMFFANGPAEVRDVLSGWSDRPNTVQTGSIQGRILNADTGASIPDILVTAAGQRTFTDSAGRFNLQSVGVGTHNLVAYAVDGTFETFQQGATVAAGLNTAVEVRMKAAPLVRITFAVSAPNDIQGAPIRIAGNLIELGNTYADLRGGMSTIAERMPVMTLQPDGRYSASIILPSGAYVQYKYTLGDGFWNAEHDQGGGFRIREFIVPSEDSVVQDAVEAWTAGTSSPILFETSVPSNTPAQDIVSIQFNAYTWSEPIPMWPRGGNQWIFKLYGPINTLGSLHYRYCRAGQCGSADDNSTAGDSSPGRAVETSLVSQHIQDTVAEWAWLQETEPGTLVGTEITPRASGFVAGVELQAAYMPNWEYLNPQTVQGVQALGANWILYTPGWSYAGSDPPVFGIRPEKDPFWLDSTIMISQARAANLNVGIFPAAHFDDSVNAFWNAAPRDPTWWQSWFEQYRAFAVHHADLAAQTGSQALILGGDWLAPALPEGTLPDGSSSGVPADADLRWKAILDEVRQHFSGPVWWGLPLEAGLATNPPSFLGDVDAIYVLWDAPLSADATASKGDLELEAGSLLDSEIAPLASISSKPIFLGLAYPSVQGVRIGCPGGSGQCMHWDQLNQPGDPTAAAVDLSGQADLYEAMLNAINSRAYVAGIVSRGFYPPTLLQDKSASVHGKPAADLLWYWFPRLTGAVR